MKFCVDGTLEENMRASLHWGDDPVNQTLQNQGSLSWLGDAVGEEMRLCKLFCS